MCVFVSGWLTGCVWLTGWLAGSWCSATLDTVSRSHLFCMRVCPSVRLAVWLSGCVCLLKQYRDANYRLVFGNTGYCQLFICFVCLAACVCVCVSVCLSWLVGWLAVCLASWLTLSVCLSWLAGWLTVCLAGCVCVCLIVYLAVSLAGWLSFCLSFWMDG